MKKFKFKFITGLSFKNFFHDQITPDYGVDNEPGYMLENGNLLENGMNIVETIADFNGQSSFVEILTFRETRMDLSDENIVEILVDNAVENSDDLNGQVILNADHDVSMTESTSSELSFDLVNINRDTDTGWLTDEDTHESSENEINDRSREILALNLQIEDVERHSWEEIRSRDEIIRNLTVENEDLNRNLEELNSKVSVVQRLFKK